MEIMKGAAIGGVGGMLILFALFRKKKIDKEPTMEENNLSISSDKKSIFDRWSIRLALFGLALGIFAGFSLKTTNIAFIIGLGLPIALFLGAIGLVIDFINNRKK
jgi:hypothetical protein